MPALEAAVRIGLDNANCFLFLAIAGASANWPNTHSFCPSRKELAQAASAALDIIMHEIGIPARELVRGVERAA